MNWRYMALEGYCLYDEEDYTNVPCSNRQKGVISLNCLECNNKKEICKYFGFKKARSCVILTDLDGNEIQHKSFESEEIDEDLWLKNEEKWSKIWKKKLEE